MADTWCKRAENELILRSFNNDMEAALCCKSQDPVNLFEKGSLQKVKDDLDNGIRHKHCTICWVREDAGLQSWRVIGNLSEVVGKTVEVYLDNTCDLACIYCSQKYSSKWAQEILYATPKDRELLNGYLNDKKFVQTKKEDHIKIILDTITEFGRNLFPWEDCTISLLGGEPLLSPYLKKNIIDDIVSAFYAETTIDKKLKLLVVTNGNTPDALIDKTIKAMEESKKQYPNVRVLVSLSMESTNKVAEFIRYGLDWNQFIKNYKKYLDADIEVGFSVTLNIVSLFELSSFMKQMFDIAKIHNNKKIFFNINTVEYPRFLSIATLDNRYKYIFDEVKDIVKHNEDNILRPTLYKQLLTDIQIAENSYATDVNSTYHKKALDYFDYLSRARKTDIKDIHKDLYDFLTSSVYGK